MAVEKTRSLSRALSILKIVARARGVGMRLATITRETGISKTTTIRLIQTLLEEGMLVRGSDGKYRLGPESHALGAGTHDYDLLVQRVTGPVRRIAIACGDSAFFSIRSALYSICLIREDGGYPLKTHVLQPGTRLPLGVGAGGIAILAALDDSEIERCMQANRAECEQRYPEDLRARMLERIQECREKGYAINRGSVVRESWAVAAMIRDPNGAPIAALTIAAIQSRLQPEREAELGPWLMKEAALLELLIRSDCFIAIAGACRSMP